MVEAGGVEPPSAKDPQKGATCLVYVLILTLELPQTKFPESFPQKLLIIQSAETPE